MYTKNYVVRSVEGGGGGEGVKLKSLSSGATRDVSLALRTDIQEEKVR